MVHAVRAARQLPSESPFMTAQKSYQWFLAVVSGLAGLLYGIDIGIIDPALPYLNRATSLSDGNLYVTRHGKGTVVKLSPRGAVLREIALPGSKPSNICFGGPDGRTAYVTEVEHGRLLQFRVDRPGLEWQRLHPQP